MRNAEYSIYNPELQIATRDIDYEQQENIRKREAGKRLIHEQITAARNSLLERVMHADVSKRTYAIEFDLAAYDILRSFQGVPGYEEAKEELDSYTEFQLQTMLGERFHTGLSSYKSSVKEGAIYADGMQEPMLDVITRGRDFRKLHGSRETKREDAEVIGFAKIQEVLADPETPIGTKMLSVSLPGKTPGSIYTKNFYDGYEKKQDEDGNIFIEVNRYSSALTVQEALQKIRDIDPEYAHGFSVDDAYLLANPIQIDASYPMFATLDAVHQYFHKEHQTFSREEFAEIIRRNQFVRDMYKKTLLDDADKVPVIFNGVLNDADAIKDELIEKRNTDLKNSYTIFDLRGGSRVRTKADIVALGRMPVKVVNTGCGISGGYGVEGPGMFSGGPYSVGYFGTEQQKKAEDDPNLCRCKMQSPHFHCPGTVTNKNKAGKLVQESCNYEITVGKGISQCPKCGAGKRC